MKLDNKIIKEVGYRKVKDLRGKYYLGAISVGMLPARLWLLRRMWKTALQAQGYAEAVEKRYQRLKEFNTNILDGEVIADGNEKNHSG